MRVLFIGSKSSGFDALRTLHKVVPKELCGAVTLDDSGDSRSAIGRFRDYCDQSSIQLSIAQSRKDSERLISEYQPDLTVMFGWYWILDFRVLRGRAVGVHYSPLPRYRGSSPLVWQIMRGETRTCTTLFQVDQGMDTGDIFDQRFTEIGPDDYIGDVAGRLTGLSMEMLAHCIPRIIDGSLQARRQDHLLATYCSQRQPDDGRIDWREKAETLYNAIRAQARPYPGAFTTFNGRRLTIWRSRLFGPEYSGEPGAVVRVSDEGVYVTCGDHRAVILQELQLEGAEPVNAREIVRSVKVRF